MIFHISFKFFLCFLKIFKNFASKNSMNLIYSNFTEKKKLSSRLIISSGNRRYVISASSNSIGCLRYVYLNFLLWFSSGSGISDWWNWRELSKLSKYKTISRRKLWAHEYRTKSLHWHYRVQIRHPLEFSVNVSAWSIANGIKWSFRKWTNMINFQMTRIVCIMAKMNSLELYDKR